MQNDHGIYMGTEYFGPGQDPDFAEGWWYHITMERGENDAGFHPEETITLDSCGPFHSQQEANDNGEIELARQIQSMG